MIIHGGLSKDYVTLSDTHSFNFSPLKLFSVNISKFKLAPILTNHATASLLSIIIIIIIRIFRILIF
jgi:hypothetical protein